MRIRKAPGLINAQAVKANHLLLSCWWRPVQDHVHASVVSDKAKNFYLLDEAEYILPIPSHS